MPTKYQTTKGSISDALQGLQKQPGTNGIDIYKLKGWDYAGMCEVLEPAIQRIRDTHTPAVFHIQEITQPQGHSTSGSHERYKSQERLAWEREWDCNRQMREWILANEIAEEHQLVQIELEVKNWVKESKNSAWEKYITPLRTLVAAACEVLKPLAVNNPAIKELVQVLADNKEPLRKDVLKTLEAAIDIAGDKQDLSVAKDFYNKLRVECTKIYNTLLYNEGPKSA